MNLLDRILSALSPQLGFKRASYRAAMEEVRLRNRYEAARADRALDGWMTSGASANTEIGSQFVTLRNRARDLGRNNPFLCRAFDLLAAKMVGTGIRPRLTDAVPTQVRERTMGLWSQWCDECDAEGLSDLYGLQLLAARTVAESGEAIIRFDPAPGRRIPWTIKVLESDWIDHSQDRVLDDGGAVRLGIEYNRSGQRVAYHMFTEHPGDSFFMRGTRDVVVRVPADRIAHVFYRMRPEQVRGVPWCTPSVTTARNLDDLNDARLKRAKVQACFAAFIYKNPESSTITTEAETGRRRQQLAPGIVEYLLPEEQVTFGTPPRGEADDEWQVMLLHTIAAGVGLTYAQLTGDLRQTNYSSMRAGSLDFWSLLDSWQHHMLIPMMCRPIWKKFDLNAAAYTSRREYPVEVAWDLPERPFVDPEKDGAAIDAALLAGRRTFHEVIAATGRDPEEHIAELRRERVELRGLNLPHITPDVAPNDAATPGNGAMPLEDMPAQETMQ